jgi:hypothetical protein
MRQMPVMQSELKAVEWTRKTFELDEDKSWRWIWKAEESGLIVAKNSTKTRTRYRRGVETEKP